MRGVIAVVLGVFAAAAAAETREEIERIVAADKAHWADVRVVTEDFRPAPAGWHRVDDAEYRIALSFPCEPKRRVRKEGSIIQYECFVEDRSYGVLLQHRNLSKNVIPVFLAGLDSAQLKGVLAKDPSARSVPTKKLAYGDATGRQNGIATTGTHMESRTLIRDGFAYELIVSDWKAAMPGDVETFFRAVELK